MRHYLVLVFLLNSFLSFSQFGELIDGIVSDSIIKKNKVYKCTLTYLEDSLYFENRNQKNPYMIFNSEGLKSEINFYQGGTNAEIKTIFIYNKNKKLKTWLWYDQNAIPPISRVVINHFDSTNKITDSEDFMDLIDNIRNSYKKEILITDTITNKRVQLFITTNLNGDTIQSTVQSRNNEGLIDSTVTKFFEANIYTSKTIREFKYKEGVKSKFIFKSYNKDNLIEISNYTFSINGLPNTLKTTWFHNQEKHEVHSKFVYNFYN